ncbi:hypothetical protein LCGC14_1384980 [marine sediment metagenome]|uniref:Uncharacterized protein n=1 Tax=marine sediment metagenome TaxID=412755 RepID=A0A0F9K1V4_9ZZZZ
MKQQILVHIIAIILGATLVSVMSYKVGFIVAILWYVSAFSFGAIWGKLN